MGSIKKCTHFMETEIDLTWKSGRPRQRDQASEMSRRTSTVSICSSDCDASPFQLTSPPTLKALCFGSGFSPREAKLSFNVVHGKFCWFSFSRPPRLEKNTSPDKTTAHLRTILLTCKEAIPQLQFLVAHYGNGGVAQPQKEFEHSYCRALQNYFIQMEVLCEQGLDQF